MRRAALCIGATFVTALGINGVLLGRATAAPVYLNAAFADKGVEPVRFSPNSGLEPNTYFSLAAPYVEGLTWSSWGGPQATATGQVRLLTDLTSASPVTVTLRGLESCGGVTVYSTYTLELAAGARMPRLWPKGQRGVFPCLVNAGAYIPGAKLARKPEAQGGCVLHGLEPNSQPTTGLPWAPLEGPSVRWHPRLPRGSAYSGFCRMQWSNWGAPTVTGKGVLRNGFKQWGVNAQLTGVGWCQRLGVAYTSLTMTLYGNGEPIPHGGNVSRGEAARLTRDIGRLSPHTYRQTEPAAAHCGR